MGKLSARTTRNVGGKGALLVGTLLGQSAGPAHAYPGLPSPSLEVTVAQSSHSEKLVCAVAQTLPPAGTSAILARIKVPHDSTLKSALLRTASGELALEVTDSVPLIGEYEVIIDNEKTNCAGSGTLFLDVEGELETKTTDCPGIVLPKATTCNE